MIYVVLGLIIILVVYQEFYIRSLEDRQEKIYNNLLSLAKNLEKRGIITLVIKEEEDEF